VDWHLLGSEHLSAELQQPRVVSDVSMSETDAAKTRCPVDRQGFVESAELLAQVRSALE
jgi:hypothetical protein